MSNLSLEDGTWTITPAGGNIVGVDIVRQYVPNSNQGGNTIAYEGYTPEACTLAEITVFMKSLNTQGTYTVTFTNVTTGNTVLSTANFDMQTLTANTWTALTLTGTSSDLTFAADDRFRVVFASNNASFDGSGVYFSMRFTSNTSYTPRAMDLIFSTTLTSDVSSISTGTLPTGFNSFLIKARLRCDRSNALSGVFRIYFNGDETFANYQRLVMQARNGSSTPTTSEAASPITIQATSAIADAGHFSVASISVYSPESSGYKAWTQEDAVPFLNLSSTSVGDRQQHSMSGLWLNNAPITSITCKSTGIDADGVVADFVAGSSFQIYGLR